MEYLDGIRERVLVIKAIHCGGEMAPCHVDYTTSYSDQAMSATLSSI
jgi:hypothetical protein